MIYTYLRPLLSESKWRFRSWPSTFCYFRTSNPSPCCSWAHDFPSVECPTAGWADFKRDLPIGRPHSSTSRFLIGHLVIIYVIRIYPYTSSARTSRGRKFQREKTISQRKNLPIECAQGDRPARCPNHYFAVNEPSAVPWWWCFVLWSEVFLIVLMFCCGVRSCDGHVIWCDVMACVVSCHVMQCDVMVMSCTTPVLLCTTKYYSSTNLYNKVLLCTTKYYSSTTLYYKVLLQY